MEVCDLDSSNPGYNLVIYATGSMQGAYLEIHNSDYSTMASIASGSSLMNGYGSFSELSPSNGHLIKKVSGNGSFEINAANPMQGVSNSTYLVSVPYTMWGSEQVPSSLEYDIIDITGSGAVLARDSGLYSAASWGAYADNLPAGTAIVPRKLVISQEGGVFVYIEAPVSGYLPVDVSQGALY